MNRVWMYACIMKCKEELTQPNFKRFQSTSIKSYKYRHIQQSSNQKHKKVTQELFKNHKETESHLKPI